MFTYPQGHQQFYENQRQWGDIHLPPPTQYHVYDENDYYYTDRAQRKRDRKRQDAMNYRKEELYHEYPYYYEQDNEHEDVYYYQQAANGHPNHRYGARSASPLKRKDRKRQSHRKHHKSNATLQNEAWMQPAPFVNHQPMTMDPMMNSQHQQRILGTCTTDAMMPIANYEVPANTNPFPMMPQPVPMMSHIQPYHMQFSSNANFPPPPTFVFHHHQQQPMLPFVPQPLLNDLFNNLAIHDNDKTNEKPAADADERKDTPPVQEAKTTPSSPTYRPTHRPLQRRRSMIETVLSSFSLLGGNQSNTIANKSWDPSSYVPLNDALNKSDTDAKNDSTITSSLSPRSFSSASATHEEGGTVLLRGNSLKLSQKMNALQSRHSIWCYKPQNEEAALWAAFDVKNQLKLDHYYAVLMSKKQQQQQQQQPSEGDHEKSTHTTSLLQDDVITLSKQSQLNGPVMVSLSNSTAWCFENDSSFSFGSSGQKHVLLDVACLPSQQNRFVVSNQLISKDPMLKRSKSIDEGVASKFINSILKW